MDLYHQLSFAEFISFVCNYTHEHNLEFCYENKDRRLLSRLETDDLVFINHYIYTLKNEYEQRKIYESS